MPSNSTLLSLDEHQFTTKIVDYCAEGRRGYQSLLQLRTVCKTTKKWVDNLPPTISRRIFLETLIHIEATRENLKNYLESSFSALHVPNLFFQLKHDSWDMNMEDPRDGELNLRFDSFWKPRIEYLEIVSCTEKDITSEEDTNLPKLRELKCHSFHAQKNSDPAALLRHFPFGTERISVTYLDLTPTQTEAFYRRLVENAETLKYFATAPFYAQANSGILPSLRLPRDMIGTVRCLTQLVNAKSSDPDFELVLNFIGFPGQIEGHENEVALMECFLAMLNSVSKIQLHCFPEEYLKLTENILKEEMTQDLCNRVHSVPYIFFHPQQFMNYTFPNMNYIGLTIPPGTSAVDLRPYQNLTRLGTFGYRSQVLNAPNLLIPTLTQLRVCNWKASVMTLVQELNLISSNCPVLKTLIMSYEVVSDEIPPREAIDAVSLQNTSIRSVTLRIEKGCGVCATLAEVISKAVCNLPLRKLKLELPYASQIDEYFFLLLKTPPILENITSFSINEFSVTPAAFPMMNEMKLYAEMNKVRLRSSPQIVESPKRTKRIYSLENDVEIICKDVQPFDLTDP